MGRQSIPIGRTLLQQKEVDATLKELRPLWPASSYHLTRRNCLCFAQEFVKRLEVHQQFPDWITRLCEVSTGNVILEGITEALWATMKWWTQRTNDPNGFLASYRCVTKQRGNRKSKRPRVAHSAHNYSL